jgi:hypothetical protein
MQDRSASGGGTTYSVMPGRYPDHYVADRATRSRRGAADHRTFDHRALVLAPRPRAQAAAPRPRTTEKSNLTRNPAKAQSGIFSKVFTAAVIAALWIGWVDSDDNGLTPVSGIGYWLGIVGSSLMLLLLLYPLRKRMRSLRGIGSVTSWFHAHMILGVVGPVVIMWHANFKLGSINCSVALITMLVVAISGVIGRYLHRKINMGLYGRKAEAQEVVADADELLGFLGSDTENADVMVVQLNAFAQLGTRTPNGILAGLVLLPYINWRGAIIRKRLIDYARQVIAIEGRRRGRSQQVRRQQLAGVTDFVTQHVAAVRRAAAFALYERLFGLWHIFHLPLFVLLVIVAIIHVYASHFF